MDMQRAKELLPIIQAFSEGKQIECLASYGEWKPIKEPKFDDLSAYRIAKEKKWYRVALCDTYTTTADTEEEEKTYEECGDFIRWLGDRFYYDVD